MKTPYLSKREQQIMDAVYRLGQATAKEIVANIPEPPTNDAVRRLIRILEDKGWLRHKKTGHEHVYLPTVRPEKARLRALEHTLQTYFHGSAAQAMAALIDSRSDRFSDEDWEEITHLIEKAKLEGR